MTKPPSFRLAVALIALLLVIAGGLYLALHRSGQPDQVRVRQSLPSDHFTAVDRESYRPRSVPIFESKERRTLPPGVDPLQVSRTVDIRLKDGARPLSIVEMKNGDVLLERDSTIEGVEVTDFTSPIFRFDPSVAIGLTISPGKENRWAVRPVVSFSFMEICGVARFPTVAADTDGFALGAEGRLYHGIWAGVGTFWRYSDLADRSIRFTIQYTL